MRTTESWVRYVDRKFVFTYRILDEKHGLDAIRSRPLTFKERVMWFLLARRPQP